MWGRIAGATSSWLGLSPKSTPPTDANAANTTAAAPTSPNGAGTSTAASSSSTTAPSTPQQPANANGTMKISVTTASSNPNSPVIPTPTPVMTKTPTSGVGGGAAAKTGTSKGEPLKWQSNPIATTATTARMAHGAASKSRQKTLQNTLRQTLSQAISANEAASEAFTAPTTAGERRTEARKASTATRPNNVPSQSPTSNTTLTTRKSPDNATASRGGPEEAKAEWDNSKGPPSNPALRRSSTETGSAASSRKPSTASPKLGEGGPGVRKSSTAGTPLNPASGSPKMTPAGSAPSVKFAPGSAAPGSKIPKRPSQGPGPAGPSKAVRSPIQMAISPRASILKFSPNGTLLPESKAAGTGSLPGSRKPSTASPQREPGVDGKINTHTHKKHHHLGDDEHHHHDAAGGHHEHAGHGHHRPDQHHSPGHPPTRQRNASQAGITPTSSLDTPIGGGLQRQHTGLAGRPPRMSTPHGARPGRANQMTMRPEDFAAAIAKAKQDAAQAAAELEAKERESDDDIPMAKPLLMNLGTTTAPVISSDSDSDDPTSNHARRLRFPDDSNAGDGPGPNGTLTLTSDPLASARSRKASQDFDALESAGRVPLHDRPVPGFKKRAASYSSLVRKLKAHSEATGQPITAGNEVEMGDLNKPAGGGDGGEGGAKKPATPAKPVKRNPYSLGPRPRKREAHGLLPLWACGVLSWLCIVLQACSIWSDSWIEDHATQMQVRGKDLIQWITLEVTVFFGLCGYICYLCRAHGLQFATNGFKVFSTICLCLQMAGCYFATSWYDRDHGYIVTDSNNVLIYGSSYNFCVLAQRYLGACILLVLWQEVEEFRQRQKTRKIEASLVKLRKLRLEADAAAHAAQQLGLHNILMESSAFALHSQEVLNQITQLGLTSETAGRLLAAHKKNALPSAETMADLQYSLFEDRDYLNRGQRRLIWSSTVFFFVIFGGGMFYAELEGWNVRPAIDFAIVSLATIGYGNLAPRTDLGKVFLYIYFPVGFAVVGFTIKTWWTVVLIKIDHRVSYVSAWISKKWQERKLIREDEKRLAEIKEGLRLAQLERRCEVPTVPDGGYDDGGGGEDTTEYADEEDGGGYQDEDGEYDGEYEEDEVNIERSRSSRGDRHDYDGHVDEDDETEDDKKSPHHHLRHHETEPEHVEVVVEPSTPGPAVVIHSTGPTPLKPPPPPPSPPLIPAPPANASSNAGATLDAQLTDPLLMTNSSSAVIVASPTIHDITPPSGLLVQTESALVGPSAEPAQSSPILTNFTQVDPSLMSMAPQEKVFVQPESVVEHDGSGGPKHLEEIDPNVLILAEADLYSQYGGPMKETPEMKQKRKERAQRIKLLCALFFSFCWVLLSSAFFSHLEGWRYFDSIWFCYVTLTTIGYGDFYPSNSDTSAFFIWFVIFGLGSITYILTLLTEIMLEDGAAKLAAAAAEKRKMEKVKARLKKAQSDLELLKAERDAALMYEEDDYYDDDYYDDQDDGGEDFDPNVKPIQHELNKEGGEESTQPPPYTKPPESTDDAHVDEPKKAVAPVTETTSAAKPPVDHAKSHDHAHTSVSVPMAPPMAPPLTTTTKSASSVPEAPPLAPKPSLTDIPLSLAEQTAVLNKTRVETAIMAPPQVFLDFAEEFDSKTKQMIETARACVLNAQANPSLFTPELLDQYHSSYLSLLKSEEKRKKIFETQWMKNMINACRTERDTEDGREKMLAQIKAFKFDRKQKAAAAAAAAALAGGASVSGGSGGPPSAAAMAARRSSKLLQPRQSLSAGSAQPGAPRPGILGQPPPGQRGLIPTVESESSSDEESEDEDADLDWSRVGDRRHISKLIPDAPPLMKSEQAALAAKTQLAKGIPSTAILAGGKVGDVALAAQEAVGAQKFSSASEAAAAVARRLAAAGGKLAPGAKPNLSRPTTSLSVPGHPPNSSSPAPSPNANKPGAPKRLASAVEYLAPHLGDDDEPKSAGIVIGPSAPNAPAPPLASPTPSSASSTSAVKKPPVGRRSSAIVPGSQGGGSGGLLAQPVKPKKAVGYAQRVETNAMTPEEKKAAKIKAKQHNYSSMDLFLDRNYEELEIPGHSTTGTLTSSPSTSSSTTLSRKATIHLDPSHKIDEEGTAGTPKTPKTPNKDAKK